MGWGCCRAIPSGYDGNTQNSADATEKGYCDKAGAAKVSESDELPLDVFLRRLSVVRRLREHRMKTHVLEDMIRSALSGGWLLLRHAE